MACVIFAVLGVLLDQLSKMWISRSLDIAAQQELIPGILGLTHVQNTGASFGILADQRWLLVGISSACLILLIVLITQFKSALSRFGLAAVLGGAAGNMIDRILHGYVVDMFEFKFMNFAIFNVADCFITIGGLLFVISIIAAPREQRAAKPEAAAQSGGKVSSVKSSGVKSSGSVSPSSIFGGTVKDLSETKILEEYDIERLLREYNSDEMDD